MSDSQFRKAIQQKMAEGNAVPSADNWLEINEAIAKERAKRKQKNRGLLLLILPLLAMGFGVWFWSQSGVNITPEETLTTISYPSRNDVSGDIVATDSQLNNTIATDKNELHSDQHKVEQLISNYIPKTKESSNQKSFKNELGGSRLVEQSFYLSEVATENLKNNPKSETTLKEPKNGGQLRAQIAPMEAVSAKAAQIIFAPKIPIFSLSENEVAIETESKKSSPKLSLGLGYEQNALEYCFQHVGQNQRVQLEFEYRFLSRFSAGVGFGFQTINYDFEIDSSVHVVAFGNTDKYPGFYENKAAVQSIKSEMSHLIIPISIKYHQPILRNLEAFVGTRQDFLFNENQNLIYALSGNATPLTYEGNNNDFQLGFTSFSAGLEYQIHPKLKAGVAFNRLISFETLGIERQYYHGFGGGANLIWQF